MSKQMTIYFLVNNEQMVYQRFKVALQLCCDAKYNAFSVEFLINISIDDDFLPRIIAIEREVSKLYSFSAKYSIVCRMEQLQKINLPKLCRRNCIVKILLDDIRQITSKSVNKTVHKNPCSELHIKCSPLLINKLETSVISKSEIPIRFEFSECSSTDYLKAFDDWISVQNPANISNYIDALNLILMNERSGCEHNSCLGRILSIDNNGMSYWCRHNLPGTELACIEETESFGELFCNGSFEKNLDIHYKKRGHCRRECVHFNVCLSGCPLQCNERELADKCTEQEYIQLINHMTGTLKKFINTGDISVLNKYAKTSILNAIASAPFSGFFIEMNAEQTR